MNFSSIQNEFFFCFDWFLHIKFEKICWYHSWKWVKWQILKKKQDLMIKVKSQDKNTVIIKGAAGVTQGSFVRDRHSLLAPVLVQYSENRVYKGKISKWKPRRSLEGYITIFKN